MAMDKERTTKCRGPHGMIASRVIALLLIIYLVECTSEQRISRGKPSNVVDRINGWRSQRGGSCLSYGHSCWGAHGKRSGKTPAAAPDWFLSRLLRRMALNTEMNNENQAPSQNELSAIFQGLSGDNTPSTDKLTDNDDGPIEVGSRNLGGKPMLDEDLLSKIKIWQIMKESSEEK